MLKQACFQTAVPKAVALLYVTLCRSRHYSSNKMILDGVIHLSDYSITLNLTGPIRSQHTIHLACILLAIHLVVIMHQNASCYIQLTLIKWDWQNREQRLGHTSRR
jgi:hypothetical protein